MLRDVHPTLKAMPLAPVSQPYVVSQNAEYIFLEPPDYVIWLARQGWLSWLHPILSNNQKC